MQVRMTHTAAPMLAPMITSVSTSARDDMSWFFPEPEGGDATVGEMLGAGVMTSCMLLY